MLLKFVTARAATPTVLLDVSNAPFTTLGRDFSLGVPEWHGSPGSVAAEDGFRQIRFKLQISTGYTAAAAAMSSLSQQLLRVEGGWLMFRMGTMNKAMFIRYYRSQQQDLAWENSGAKIYELNVALDCDPYLYSEQETIGPVTITNDPSTGTNKAFYSLPTVKGDAPTPASVDIAPSIDWVGVKSAVSIIPLNSTISYTAPILWATAGMTAGTDTGTEQSSASYVGGKYRVVTFATNAAMVNRLTGASFAAPPPGTYKVWCRMGRSDLTTTWAARFALTGASGTVYYGDTAYVNRGATTTNGWATWVDLGEQTFPQGIAKMDETDTATSPLVSFALQVQRTGGTGSVNINCIELWPVDLVASVAPAATLKTTFTYGPLSTTSARLIGDRQVVHGYASSGAALWTGLVYSTAGGFPVLTPGATNIMHLIHQTQTEGASVAAADAPDVITATEAVTVTYYPRWLHLRPDTA